MVPVIHNYFLVAISLFPMTDWTFFTGKKILLVPAAEVKSSETRNGKQMIGRLKDVLKWCGVLSCVVRGVAPPRIRCMCFFVCLCV